MNAQKALPATDLSGAFAKPGSRAAGLRLPTRKAPQEPQKAPQRPVSPVPDPMPAEPANGPEIGSTPPGEPADAKPKAKKAPAKKAAARQAAAPKSTSAKAPAAKKASGRATATRPAAGQGRLVLWTPKRIRKRMQAVQAKKGTSYLDQVLDAIEATVDDLPDLVATGAEPTAVKGKLFERTVANPDAEPEPGDRVQLTIRGVLDSQLAVIDELVKSSGAKSRSALVNAALDAALPKG